MKAGWPRDILRNLQQPFVRLWTVPAFIALAIGAVSPLIIFLEMNFAKGNLSPWAMHFDADTARTVLSVVAGGAMTALSLAYSLVLLVFTLAAGNIGPRLLKRFTSDIVNQITAGIFGGTFLYALVTLHFVEQSFVPKFTIAGAGFLAILSVMQLIFFVREVSKSVTIDDEIAEITARLKNALSRHYDNLEPEPENPPEVDEFEEEISCNKAGYLASLDHDGMVSYAAKNDLVFKLLKRPGDFVVPGEPLLETSRKLDDEAHDEVLDLISIESARSDQGAMAFSANLLVEIGLRALSPGVNDTYTALAVVDSLSNAFGSVADIETSQSSRKDDDGVVRVVLAESPVAQLADNAFRHLRLASTGNVLMAQGLARAFSRLHALGERAIATMVEEHAELMLDDLEATVRSESDIRTVRNLLPRGMVARIDRKRREKEEASAD